MHKGSMLPGQMVTFTIYLDKSIICFSSVHIHSSMVLVGKGLLSFSHPDCFLEERLPSCLHPHPRGICGSD